MEKKERMKRGKDGENMMGPMFPRLHVNDTEKGGPRAPPRNKMALYEQLSIPSQRFTRVNSNSSQVSGNEQGLFFSCQMPLRHLSDNQYSQYSDLSPSLAQVEQAKKSDEDDYSAPIFIHSIPSKNSDTHSNKFQTVKDTGMLEHSMDQEGENKNGDNLENCSDGSRTDDTARYCGNRHSIAALEKENKRYSSISKKATPSDHNDVRNLCNETGENLERDDSVSETSILDVVCELDMMTPDDIVGVIGQKHFWKTRRAIVKQQRVFAVQVFELHRVIKVQKLIAASPHFLLEDSTYFSKPIKPLAPKQLPLDYTVKTTPNAPKRKADFENPAGKKECSAENTLEKKASLSSALNGPSNGNSIKPCFNQPQGHHWLIPMMSPSEGLVYKPYPEPGYAGCGPPGPDPMMGNFLASAYGVPIPHPQYHFPSFPPFVSHGYFPPYSMPIMNMSAFSGSSVEQTNPGPLLPAHISSHKNRPDDDIGVQASTASSPNEKRLSSRTSSAAEGKNMLPLFPMDPANGASDSGSQDSGPEGPARVIKVVPRGGVSASEHAARIFRSIQEERKQYESV